MSTRLADCLQVWGFENDFVVFSDGSLGFGLELQSIDLSCWDNDRTNHLAGKLSNFLNSLPNQTDLQFIQDIQGGNQRVIAEHLALVKDTTDPVAQSLCFQRGEKLKQYDAHGFLPRHILKVFVRRPFSEALIHKPKLFSKESKFQAVAAEKLAKEVAATEHLRGDLIQSLNTIGLRPTPISADQVMDLIYTQWNPTRKIERPQHDPEDVRSSVLFTDVSISKRDFLLSDIHHRVISLKLLPDQTHAAMSSALGDLPFGSRLFLSIHVNDQAKELESLQAQRRIAFSMSRGKRSGVADIESAAKLEDLETLLEQMVSQGEKVFRVSLNVLLKSHSTDELENQISQTLMTLRDLAGAEGMEESIATFPIFSELSIPNSRATTRSRRVKTSNLCDLLPIYGPWPGFEKPSVLLRNRMGSLFSFDPFSSDLANANQLISGGSGSGKSFLTNILLLQMLKENPKIFFVDIGGSYKKICENLDGQYLPLGNTDNISINPFDLAPGEINPSGQKIKFLLGLVELMTKEDNETRLPKLHRAEVENAIQRVYSNNKHPRLTDLKNELLKYTDGEISRYGRILGTWCGDSPYGKFIDRETTIHLKKSVVAFDLKGMESTPDLQAVCLFIITDLVWRDVQLNREQMKFLVFDECWKLLKSESGMAFIEEVFRTFRKYYASAIAIAQDMDDFAKSKISGAILPNCSVKWVLMQQQSDPHRIKEALDLNDNELELVKSLNQQKGVYSEAFLIAQKHRIVAVVESTPLEYWIATSDPKDLAELESYSASNSNQSKLKILEALSVKYPKGVAAA